MQSTTNAIERARDTYEPVLKLPVLKLPVLNQPEEPASGEAGGEEPERQVTCAMGEHAFQAFKGVYPKIAGKFLNEDLARVEFLKSKASWNMIIRGAQHYAASSIVKRAMDDGGRGIKYPNNFIRDGTWKDWQMPEIFENEDEVMTRKAKDELTRVLKRQDGSIGDLSPEAKRFFYTLKTHWTFLRKMALENQDIAGPQTAGLRYVKMLAAEGVSHAL